MNDITVIIVAKDKPLHIFETVESIKTLADEIVILDIGLQQEIIQKLKDYKNLHIITIKKNIPYVELIREESKSYAKTEYVLFLDPDEIIPQTLAKKILDEYKKYDFISIPRKNIIFGKWIQNARWWPDYQIRLFKKNAVTWHQKLHSQPTTHGNGTTFEAKEELAITHHNYENITEYLMKMIRYAKSDAAEKSKTEYRLRLALKDGLNEFISRYFAGHGYKDGMHGFILATLQAIYYLLVYSYYWEERKYAQIEPDVYQAIDQTGKRSLFEIQHWLSKENLFKRSGGIKRKILQFLLRDS